MGYHFLSFTRVDKHNRVSHSLVFHWQQQSFAMYAPSPEVSLIRLVAVWAKNWFDKWIIHYNTSLSSLSAVTCRNRNLFCKSCSILGQHTVAEKIFNIFAWLFSTKALNFLKCPFCYLFTILMFRHHFVKSSINVFLTYTRILLFNRLNNCI